MKYCIQCGKELKTGAKFCSACGKRQNQEQTETTTVETVLEKGAQTQSSINEQLKSNQTVQQLTKESKNYFSWLNSQIKGNNTNTEQASSIFGVINFLILSVVNSLAISRSMLRMDGYGAETVLSLFIENLFVIGIYFTLFGSVYFVASTKISKKKGSFIVEFSALIRSTSLAVYISLGAFVCSFLIRDSYMIVMSLLCLVALMVSFSFTDHFWKREDILSRFGLTLLVLLGSFVVIFLLFNLVGGSKLLELFLENLK